MTLDAVNDKILALCDAYHPVNVHWEVTNRCNASCDYCFVKGRAVAELPLDDMRAIAAKLAADGFFSVCISGGEPFLRSDIVEILEAIFERRFFQVAILTNATILDERHLDFLCAHSRDISYLQVSAFSADAGINDRYFGVPGALKKICSNGARLAAAGIHVGVAVSVMPFNIDGIAAIERLFEPLGMTPIFSLGKTVCEENRRVLPDNMMNYDFFTTCFKRLPASIVNPMKENLRMCLDGGKVRTHLCYGQKSGLYIDPAGMAYACPKMRSIELGPYLSIADLAAVLRNNAEYVRFHNMTISDIETCKECRFNVFCGVCMADNMSENGSLRTASRQYCEMTRALYDSL